MNNILSVKVDATIKHSKREKIVQKLVLKMSRNGRNLGLHIINEYPIFETLRKMHGCENPTQLLIRLCLQGSNAMPVINSLIIIS